MPSSPQAAPLRGAASAESALRELANFIRGRQAVGHGARLDVDFLEAAGLWDPSIEILDTLDVARIVGRDLVARQLVRHRPTEEDPRKRGASVFVPLDLVVNERASGHWQILLSFRAERQLQLLMDDSYIAPS